ncbi:MAG: hypothetical protein M3128_04350 [Verrucomicrobiota bacterium]|nr:hypothetical protein [Verrucomicrobiota bacterium]
MSDSLSRIIAIVRADFLVRFRRPSTLIIFLLLSAFAYLWVPAPMSGRALMQIDGHRALYNSGAVGMATASIAMVFVGLFGFYVVSNAVRRDVVSRCGVIAASTPMRSSEYLLGKLFGNITFLATFTAGFMVTSMLMLLLRAEAPFQPLVFIEQYLFLTPGAIVFASAVAVLFESIRWLSGKLGDVIYFFLWSAAIGVVVSQEAGKGGITWGRYLDFTGFGFMISQTQRTLGVESISIGSAPVDPALTPIVFPGLSLTSGSLVPRIVSSLLPIVLLPIATLFFHRFDPVRTGRTSDKGKRNWLGRIQMLFKPLSRRAVGLLMRPARGISFANAVWADALLTLTLFPLAFVAIIGAAVFALIIKPADSLPIIFAALAIVISDVSTREVRAATTANLYAAPRLRENFVWWKFASAFVIALLMCVVPVLRGGLHSLGTLLNGIFFIVASATALGIVSRTAKTFIVVFLSFWYLVVNDHGASPLLDFAGFYGSGTSATILLYSTCGVLALIVAQIYHRTRLNRA